jgi:cytochrome c oxidase subunit 2
MYKTDKPEQVQEIEIFAYQFGWTARYPGADGKFGAHSFNYISGTNELGLAVKSQIEQLKLDLQEDIENAQQKLANQDAYINQLKEQIEAHKKTANFKGIKDANKEIAKVKGGEYQKELELMVRRRTKQLERMAITETDEKAIAKIFDGSVHDDFITKEVVVLKGKPVRLKFRARDVIHSAYLPDFRVQMNCVPGMETEFSFVPTKSTSEIREEKGDDKYDYYMFCNKICGQAHFNMKIKFTVVDSEADLNAWLVNQKPAFPVELPIRREVEEVEVAENLQFDKKEQTI